jgi:hypothetical protein
MPIFQNEDTHPIDGSMQRMFYGCSDLICIDHLNTTGASSTTDMFYNCNNLAAPDSTDQNNLINGADWTNPNDCPSNTTFIVDFYDPGHQAGNPYFNLPNNDGNLYEIDLENDWWRAYSNDNFTSIASDVAQQNSEIVICRKLPSSVTDISNMFDGCDTPTKIYTLPSFNTINVEEMETTFYGTGFIDVDLSLWSVRNVTNFYKIFYGSDTQTIKMPYDIANLQSNIDMTGIFANSSDLTCINFIDTRNANNATGIFDNCSSLIAPDSNDQTDIENGALWINPNNCP